ncbi:MAG: HAD-IC family P-type ATPase [Clostridia bacterium]|nr:HAD-IC family P-type ATPase [Clostridia bacterium]
MDNNIMPEENAIIGLTSEEVQERVQSGKVNGDQNVKTKSVPQILRTNIITFFNLLFVVISVILLIFVPKNLDGLSNFGFLAIVIGNLFVGIFQELKAKRTIDKLSLLSAPKVTAIRDGEKVNIALKDIVLDDAIELSAGSQICADAIVMSGSLEVNESLITGESDPITKEIGDELLSGSFVISGTAISKVIHVGTDNYATKITQGAKKLKAQNSEIANSLTKFIKIMSFILVPLGIALFSVKYFAQHNQLNDTVLTVMGTLIGMIPSGLVALTSAVFCVSVVKLSRHNALAQDLYCSEILARVDVLCLDKTGTITEGKMEVQEIIEKGANRDEIVKALTSLVRNIGDTNPTALAISDYTEKVADYQKAVSIVPFSSARKYSGINLENGSLLMGATEFVFKDMDDALKQEIESYSARGMRVIAVAKGASAMVDNALPSGLELMGLILIADKIRAEAKDTLEFFREQGVTIKIISGDNPVTVKSVAARAGLVDAENYIDASTLTTEEMVYEAAEKYTIFGRVSPDQKLMLVKALKAKGHTVGMTGDGVNDVLALREADCSIAVASGSDASKNVSKLVLLDNNFASMPKVVAEGRRCINNLQRSAALFLIKTLYNCAFAFLFMILSADLPFLPKNLTLVGYITIGPPAFILALEPNKEIVKGRFMPTVIRNALPCSIAIVLAVLTVYLASPSLNLTSAQISTVCVIVTVAIGLAFIVKLCIPFTKLRIALILALAIFFVACFFIPFTRTMFGLCNEYNLDMLILALPISVGGIGIFVGCYFALKYIPQKWLDAISNTFDTAKQKLKSLLKIKKA